LQYAQLQGTYFLYPQLQGVNLTGAYLKLSSLTKAALGKISEYKAKEWITEFSLVIKDPHRLKKFQDKLSEATKTTTTLQGAQGEDIWLQNPGEIVLKAIKESRGKLKIANSKADYQNKLMTFLINLACTDTWVAYGVIRHRKGMPLNTDFAQCLLYLKDQTNPAGQQVCPGVSQLSKEGLEELERMASRTNPEKKIKRTFKCEVGATDD